MICGAIESDYWVFTFGSGEAYLGDRSLGVFGDKS